MNSTPRSAGRALISTASACTCLSAPTLDKALLVTGFPYDRRTNPNNNIRQFTDFSLRAQGVLRLGSAALDLGAVAAGRLDGYWEFKINPWDIAAGCAPGD